MIDWYNRLGMLVCPIKTLKECEDEKPSLGS